MAIICSKRKENLCYLCDLPLPLKITPMASIFHVVINTAQNDMKSFKDLFQRKRDAQPQLASTDSPTPLRIEGIAPAPLTPEPDDAELAAAALLELLVQSGKFQVSSKHARKKHETKGTATAEPETLRSALPLGSSKNLKPETSGATAAYYRHLAEKIRQTREHQRLRVTRFLAFVEQELKGRHLPAYGPGSLGLLEAELYKRMDIVDREGGPLKHRWQHCLAEVTVRLMQAARTTDDIPGGNTEPGGNEGD